MLVVECGTHLICDAEISECRQAEASSTHAVLARWKWENCLVLWESGFHSHEAIFALRDRNCQVLGRLKRHVLLKPTARLCDGSYLASIRCEHGPHRGERLLVRVISYPFTDARIPGAGTQVSRLVTTLLDPFAFPAKELAVLDHERWQVELVIDETDTHLRLCARTLRSQTPTGVIEDLYALLLVHVLLRTLMLRAARPEGLAATRLSWTQTIALVQDSHVPLSLVSASRRQQMVGQVLKEMSTFRLPTQRVRIQARVVKRVRSRYDRKQPEHWHAPPLELDLAFHQIIAVVEGVPITSSP